MPEQKPRLREVIVVEGRYDRNALSQVVDALIFETGGVGIFHHPAVLSVTQSQRRHGRQSDRQAAQQCREKHPLHVLHHKILLIKHLLPEVTNGRASGPAANRCR